MKPRRIRDGVLFLGAIDWNRRLFDSLIPLPDGTSYNAYLVQGSEKTALLDTVDPAVLRVTMGTRQLRVTCPHQRHLLRLPLRPCQCMLRLLRLPCTRMHRRPYRRPHLCHRRMLNRPLIRGRMEPLPISLVPRPLSQT